MDQLMAEIRDYAALAGIRPGTVLHKAARLGGGTWEKWQAGKASPTMRTGDRIREWMRDNPANQMPAPDAEDAA